MDMRSSDLTTLSAGAIADAVRNGELRAVDVVEHHLQRIEKLNGAIGAFVFVDPERAEREAAAVDDRVALGEDPGPLAGVPLGVKITEDVGGWPATKASSAFKDVIAAADALHVARLRAAGAIPVGLTAAPPLGLLPYTSSTLYGTCRNPWNLERTPGGSSGGSAAALLAGLIPLATGGDIGGSLRNPAAFTGCVGVKGTYGRIPRAPGYQGASNLVHLGPLARTVRDAARFLDVAAGPSEWDPYSLVKPVASFERACDELPLTDLRVAWIREFGGAVADPNVEAVVHDAARALIATGLAEVDVGIAFPQRDDLGTGAIVGLITSDRSPEPEIAEKMTEIFVDLAQTPGGSAVVRLLATDMMGGATLDGLVAGHHYRYFLNQALAAAFEDVDAILLPTMPYIAFGAEGPIPTVLAGREVGLGAAGPFTAPFNLSGHPAVSVPAGLVDGLPVGLQIVCRRNEDHLALALAARLEAVRPWPLLAPDW